VIVQEKKAQYVFGLHGPLNLDLGCFGHIIALIRPSRFQCHLHSRYSFHVCFACSLLRFHCIVPVQIVLHKIRSSLHFVRFVIPLQDARNHIVSLMLLCIIILLWLFHAQYMHIVS